ncbi:MAG: GNAT family N-acetyltransferase [Ardenticatenaceae bacterium]|nr:GNAT family N-acetyltransferase [Ardenticatenaceae bacterium]
MLQQLQPEQYASVRKLFQGEPPPLYCEAILTGKYPGKVIVDEPASPQSALIIKDAWCHLLGDAANEAFNAALQAELADKKLIGEDRRVLFFVDPAPTWLKVLPELVADRQPIPMPRCLYVATPAYIAPTLSLPDGFELHFIDESIVDIVEGELPDDVQKVLVLRREAEVPDEVAFGFVAVNGRIITAWSVIDFIIGTVGEIRLVTESAYRRRGLALATSAATITYGLAHGLQQIDWNVAASNIPSVRAAQKLNLPLLHEPMEYMLIFPKISYLINLAWSHLDADDFEQVHAVTQQMVTSDKAMLVQYGEFLAASAWAGLGEPDKAIAHLNKAVAAGFNDLSSMENGRHLAILHHLPQWQELIERIQSAK